MSNLYEQEFFAYCRRPNSFPIDQIAHVLFEMLCNYGWETEDIEKLSKSLSSNAELQNMKTDLWTKVRE